MPLGRAGWRNHRQSIRMSLMKKIWQIVLAVAIIAAAIVVLAYYSRPRSEITPPTADFPGPEAANVTLKIEGLYSGQAVLIKSDEAVLEMLRALNAIDPQLQLITKEYAGLGILVEGLNGRQNGTDNKYWQYSVNGVRPAVGADQLKLADGDIVEWDFSPSEF